MSSATTLSSTQYKYIFGPAVFDSSLFELKVNNNIIKIERRPLDVLEALLKHVDEVMTKDELLDLVWPDIHTVENVVANAIAKLRKALGPDAAYRIVTHPKIGYRFSGPVERLAIGRKLISTMKLEPKQPILGRPNYKLVEQISAAPSREVWRARHAKTKDSRIFKFASNGEGLASLKREVTLFRILDQSTDKTLHVAKILDWNFESEPFFIECEDTGVDLKSWSKTKGQLQALSECERVRLSQDIADAVSQIHDAGILHRDLKPSNILIVSNAHKDEKLSIRLIDFGSGKMRDPQELIDFGVSPMGFTREMDDDTQLSTPLYLAPEIVQGQTHSIQSDVYSLGVITYQILSGDIDKPLVTGWRNEINDVLLISDIEMATQGSVKDRTASAAILRDSLSRIKQRRKNLEASKVLEARAVEAEIALKRTQARRPWVYATGIALTAGICASLFFGMNAQSARLDAEENATKAKATSDFLEDVLISADPRTPGVDPDVTVIESIKRAKEILLKNFPDDKTSQLEIKKTIAKIYSGLHEPVDIQIAIQKEIINDSELLYGAQSDEVRIANYDLAFTHSKFDNFEASESITSTIDTWPETKDIEVNFSELKAKGRTKLMQFKFDEAVGFYTELDALESSKETPNLNRLHGTRIDIAQAYSRMPGKRAEAVEILRTLIVPPFTESNIPKWRIVAAEQLLATALLLNQDYVEAEEILDRNIISTKEIYGEDNRRYIRGLERLASVYSSTGRTEQALELMRQTTNWECQNHGNTSQSCLIGTLNIGINNYSLGNYEIAMENIQTTRPLIDDVMGEGSAYATAANYYLAATYFEIGQNDEFIDIFKLLSVEKLSVAIPDDNWTLLLEALKARYDNRVNFSTETNARLKSIVDEMIETKSDEGLIERTSNDVRP